MIVCKFGGTSVADREARRRLAAIVGERLPKAPLVVVSALAGVSDGLLAILDLAASGDTAEDRAPLNIGLAIVTECFWRVAGRGPRPATSSGWTTGVA